ncbi:hypothetical protein GMD78_17470 [Ornithinibacillus sp. L9]|uniref:Uncharacterized protein n=1 Tax=Ornithinibacillus caprae TaxID=2678566 RepID=A0A6N8FL26_9BACI|nr:hypothetical protein [Ornithinibacillus caprae]MUK90165.1 hypothetical protein [Ornithinibacillus caprae]
MRLKSSIVISLIVALTFIVNPSQSLADGTHKVNKDGDVSVFSTNVNLNRGQSSVTSSSTYISSGTQIVLGGATRSGSSSAVYLDLLINGQTHVSMHLPTGGVHKSSLLNAPKSGNYQVRLRCSSSSNNCEAYGGVGY